MRNRELAAALGEAGLPRGGEVWRAARELDARGHRPDDVVAILLERVEDGDLAVGHEDGQNRGLGVTVPGAVTPQDILKEQEGHLRERMAQVALVAELELPRRDVESLLMSLGLLRQKFGRLADQMITDRYPACYVASVAIAANVDTVGAETWPAITNRMGIDVEQYTTSRLGRLFLRCLEALDLPTFPELDDERAMKYVSRIHLHGGIPLDHYDEFLAVVVTGIRLLGAADPDPLRAYLAERAEAGSLHGATASVDRFLRFGGDYATDFLDRSLDLLHQVTSGVAHDEVAAALPPRYVDRAFELRDAGMLPRLDTAQGRTRSTRPSLRFDPYGVGVHLQLPPVTSDTMHVQWGVNIDGTIRTMESRAPRPELPTEPVVVPLGRTVTEVAVSRDGGEPVVLQVIPPNQPALTFRADGEAISVASRLPRGAVWVLQPQEADEVEARVIEQHPTVPRWEGWTAKLVDLADVATVEIAGRRRATTGAVAAELAGGEAVPGVSTDSGARVLRSWPTLELPGTAGGATWEVAVSSGDDVERRAVTVGEEPVSIDLQRPAAERREVTVQARGPMGRSVRDTFCVVPGLRLIPSMPVRGFDQHGAAPMRVRFDGQAIPMLELDRDMPRGAVELDTGQVILVEPAAVAVQHVIDGRRTTWEQHQLRRSTEELREDPGTLAVRLPGASGHAELCLSTTDGVLVQRTTAAGRPGPDGSVVFNLARFTDELAKVGAAVLHVKSSVWSGAVVQIRPASLAADVCSWGEGRLRTIGVATDGVQVGIYPRLRPMQDPSIVEVDAGDTEIPVPPALAGLGPLRILLRLEDPWVPEPWPDMPSEGPNVFDVDQPVDFERLRILTPFAKYLVHDALLPEIEASMVDEAIELFEHAHALPVDNTNKVRSELGDELAKQPAEVLRAAADAGLETGELAELLVSTVVVARDVGDDLRMSDAEQLLRNWPAAGVVALAGRYAGRQGEDTQASARRLADHAVGPAFAALVETGEATCLGVPELDGAHLLALTPEQLRLVRGASGLAPKHLLDPDDRADDGFSLIGLLHDPATRAQVEGLSGEAVDVTNYLQYGLQNMGWPEATQIINRRLHGDGLRAIPAMSLALAISARIAARSDRPNAVFNGQSRGAMVRLTRLLPRLVGADLVMGEALVQHRLGGMTLT